MEHAVVNFRKTVENLQFAEVCGAAPSEVIVACPAAAAVATDVVDCCCCWPTVAPAADAVTFEAGITVTVLPPATVVFDVPVAIC